MTGYKHCLEQHSIEPAGTDDPGSPRRTRAEANRYPVWSTHVVLGRYREQTVGRRCRDVRWGSQACILFIIAVAFTIEWCLIWRPEARVLGGNRALLRSIRHVRDHVLKLKRGSCARLELFCSFHACAGRLHGAQPVA